VESPIANPPELVVPLTLSFDCGLDTPIPTFCAWIAVENKIATSTLEPPVIIELFFMINKVQISGHSVAPW
jgi:hypothetical protein